MNILSVLRSELSEGGDFIPCARVQKHLNETLKAQDGDILRIGIVGGQRGLAQVTVNKTMKQKGGRLIVQFKVQLLDLCFQDVQETIKVLSDISGVELPKEPTRNQSECCESFRDKSSARVDPRFGEIREDRYKFQPLTDEQLQVWWIHPYEPGILEVQTDQNMTALSKLIPKTVKILRTDQPCIDIFMALPRPRLLDKIFSSASLRESSIGESLRLGLEQGMRTTPGPVLVSASLKKALEMTKRFYAEQSQESVRSLIAHPYPIGGKGARSADQQPLSEAAQESLAKLAALSGQSANLEDGIQPVHMMSTNLTQADPGPIVLVLGPEGGFTEEEVCTLMTELPNASMVSLGKDILRCEVALLFMIAQTQMLLTAGERPVARKYNPSLNTCSIFISPPSRKKPRTELEQAGEIADADVRDAVVAEPQPN